MATGPANDAGRWTKLHPYTPEYVVSSLKQFMHIIPSLHLSLYLLPSFTPHHPSLAGTGNGDKNHPATSSASTASLSRRPHSTTNAGETRYVSSADGAVQVYSSKFSRQRPFSAKTGHGVDAGTYSCHISLHMRYTSILKEMF